MREIKPLDVKGAKDLIKDPLPPERPMELKKVDVPDLPPARVTVSFWEKMWAVLGGWLNTKVKDAADGKRISLSSFAWLQWGPEIVVGFIVLAVVVYLILR